MRYINTFYPLRILVAPVEDSDFDLRRGPDFTLLAQAAFLPSVISSFFTQNKGVGGPCPRSVTELCTLCSFYVYRRIFHFR